MADGQWESGLVGTSIKARRTSACNAKIMEQESEKKLIWFFKKKLIMQEEDEHLRFI